MIIKSIELKNIRSYKDAYIEFNEGINFLSGDIGCGKSSILIAIEFAFFGFKRGEIEGYQILRKGQNNASIKLVLYDKKKDKYIEIFRSLKKSNKNNSITQDNSYIKIDNDLIELSATELNAYIFNLLNFPKDFLTKDKNLIYRFTIYTPQEQLKEILYTLPDKRLEIIRKIFNVDKYKQLQFGINTYQSKIRVDKKLYADKLENLSKLKKEIENINLEIKDYEKRYKDILIKEEKQNNLLNKYKVSLKKNKNEQDELNNLYLKYQKEKIEIENITKQISDLELKLKKDEKNLNDILKEDIQKEILNLKKDINILSKKLDETKKNKKEKEKLVSNYEILLKEKENINQKIYLIENIKKNIENKKKEFDIVLTKCRIKDMQNFILKDESKLKKYNDKKDILKKLEEEISSLKSNIKFNTTKNNDITVQINKLSSLDKCYTCHQDVTDLHKKKIKEQFELEKKKNDKLILDDEKIKKDKLNELLELKKDLLELDKIKEDLIKKQEKLKSFKDILKDEEKKEIEIFNMNKELKELEKKDYLKQLESINKKIKEIQDCSDELKKINLIELDYNKQISDLNLKLMNYENLDKDKKILEKEIEIINKDLKEKQGKIKFKDELFEKIKRQEKELSLLEITIKKIDEGLEVIHSNLNKIIAIKSKCESSLESNKKLLKSKKEELDILIDVKKKYENILYIENFFSSQMLPICSSIEQSILTKYFNEFNEEFIKLFKELIEDNDIDVSLNLEFSPMIEQNGYDIDLKNLSGGEKSSVAIAYRLGLKRIIENELFGMQKLSLLILDEPTDGFSNQQVTRLGSILKNSNLKQIILVSHDEKIEIISDNLLKIEKKNHLSKVVNL